MRANTVVAERTGKALAPNPRLLSLRETMVLADIMEREKDIRNDIERGVVPAGTIVRFDNSRLCFNWPFVLTFAAIYGNRFLVESRELRKIAFEKVYTVASTVAAPAAEHATMFLHGPEYHVAGNSPITRYLSFCDLAVARVDIDNYLDINLAKACESVKPRMNLYAKGLSRVEEKDSVLGGAAVFSDTRLSVVHIGKMAERLIERGESIESILEDYSGLTEGDVTFARLYYRARPPVGRPVNSGAIYERTHEP